MSEARILIVDDDLALLDMLSKGLAKRGFEVETVTTVADAQARVGPDAYDVVVTDLRISQDDSGMHVVRHVQKVAPDLPVVMFTGFGSVKSAVAAMRDGAYDFLQKPVDLDVLEAAVRRASERHALLRELHQLRDAQGGAPIPLVGDSPALERMVEMLNRVADSDMPVLVTGETGTGKELAARTLHGQSSRRDGPFIAVNCAALPQHLLESELFGHKKGAFTDAKADKDGLFVAAKGGTLFLDEIAELPLDFQAKLLRTLQEMTVRPVGAVEEVKLDVRLVFATHKDLADEAAEGRFREDLLYRIQVVELSLPPLRARGHDVLKLAQVFLEEANTEAHRAVKAISPEAAKRLLAHDWPGNVRELKNAIRHAVAFCPGDELRREDLPDRVQHAAAESPAPMSSDPTQLVSLAELERSYIQRVLAASGHNKTEAARVLGIDRRTLYRKLKEYEAEEGAA